MIEEDPVPVIGEGFTDVTSSAETRRLVPSCQKKLETKHLTWQQTTKEKVKEREKVLLSSSSS